MVHPSKKLQSQKRISSTPKPANLDKQTEPGSSTSPFKHSFKSVSNNSFDSDYKESIDISKNSHFMPSDASTTGSVKSTIVVKNEEEESPSFLLPVVQKVILKMNDNLMDNNEKVNHLIGSKNFIYQAGYKSSTSSFIDHDDDDLNFEDSLQEDSFDSDR